MKRTVNIEFIETGPPYKHSGILKADQRDYFGLDSVQHSLTSFPIYIGNENLLFRSRNKLWITFSLRRRDARPGGMPFD